MLRHTGHRALVEPTAAALLALLANAAWGGSASEPTPPPAPTVKPAVRVVVVTSPATSGAPESAGGEFVVRVENAEGEGVRGVRVEFKSQSNLPPFRFAPADATTDSAGMARTTVTYGVVASANVLSATAAGVAAPATVNVTVTPGPATFVTITPTSMRLYAAGDEASFQTFVTDGFLNVIPDTPVDFKVSDPTLVSVTAPASALAAGKVRSLRGGGAATITVSSPKLSGTIAVSVYESARNACAGIVAPQDVSGGVMVAATDSVFCIGPSSQNAEYALIVYNGSTDGATSVGTTVRASNVLPGLLLGARIPGAVGSLLSRSTSLLRRSSAPRLDLRFHERLLTRSRSLRRLFAPARATQWRARSATGGIRRPLYSRSAAATMVPAVDDLLSLNVADEPCSNADLRTFRVEAVGAKAIVLADTANPSDGFSRSDYQRFAARFDTLVFPLDRDAFGEPSDIDANAHVAILFTRAVNQLTPPGSGSFIGGFFHPRDLFPREATPGVGVCATSNEGEMFYMMVPDPVGTVNGNVFSRGMVDTLTTGVLAHELQHLINASRRIYVNVAAPDFEETWLNEGLSHVAEELLYFRESGYAPRSGLTSQSILDTWPHWSAWVSDDASNFVRFYMYMLDPANHSPLDAGDDLETRGAIWAFLRYAADRSFATDAGLWQRFGNATTTGVGTLTFALQRDPRPLLYDFSLANFRGVHPSWNFGDVFQQVFAGGYQLPFGQLKEATAVPVAARGSSASYYRFAAPPDVQTLLRFGTSQAPASRELTFVLTRTRQSP
jgi:hypothetical protein